uniref:NADH-ubiquinone oxidoreductase chain 2 n=1 Tax=Neuroctenus parus TaxID=498951 RepID=B7SMG6_9HEMI|nr:NADH dehydrogenase subunit 2 [Neuroctenus parus]ABZ02060.1 NADH dehydrogenase subunit 2 [Neuroctenus parus]
MKWNIKAMIMLMMVSTMMVMSSTNWMSMWIGMEINMISFVPIMKMNYKESSGSTMIYFMAQSMGSSLFLYSLLSMWFQSPSIHSSSMLVLMMASMMIKMGLPPMHMWMITVLNNLTWMKCFMLMTWQKIAPLTVTSKLAALINETFTLALMAAIIGAIGGINQTSIRKIMGYSSVSHMGWMLTLTSNNTKWMAYLLLYAMLTFTLCYMMNSENMFYLNQINMINKMNKMAFMINMLSMGGLPPMIGFLPKWIAIQTMINNNLTVIASIMIMSSLITLMFYMNMIMPTMSTSIVTNKIKIMPEKNYSWMIIVSLMTPLALTMNILI